MSTDPLADDVLRDARRYRWILSQAVWRPSGLNCVTWDMHMPQPDIREGALTETSVGDELSAAIDKAMASTFADALGQIPKE